MWYAVIATILILADQLTKIYVAALSGVAAAPGEIGIAASNGKSIGWLVKDFIGIEYCENYNGMMGLFARFGDVNLIFIIVTIVIIVAISLFLLFSKNRSKWLRTTLTFIIAGAIGNLIDRVLTVYVRDFIHVYIFGDAFPFVFNVADAVLVVGAIMLIIYVLFMGDDAVFRSSKKKTAKSDSLASATAESGEVNA